MIGSRSGPQAPRRAHGAALILVLWLLVLLTALIGGFSQTARIEAMQAHQLRASLVARQAARSGIEYAVLKMQYPDIDRRWVPDGRKYSLVLGQTTLVIRVLDESGKVDINGASPDMLHRLLLALGVEEPRAQTLAEAIVNYRSPDGMLAAPGGPGPADYKDAGLPYGPKNKPFEAISELQRVIGMDFALYQKLAPCVTVYATGDPTPTFAQPPVLQALGLTAEAASQLQTQREAWQPNQPGAPPAMPDGQLLVVQPGTGTYDISSEAHLPDGTNLTVNAIVRASQPGPFGQLYVPLQWREGDSY